MLHKLMFDRILIQGFNLKDSHLIEFLSGSAVGLIVKMLSAISIFLMNILIARSLGASESGLFFLGFTLVTLFAAIGRLGLDQSIVRFIAARQAMKSIGQLHSVYNKSILWVFISSSTLSIILWLNLDLITDYLFVQEGFKPVLQTMLLIIPIVALYTMQAQALQGLKKIALSMMTLNVLVPFLILILMFLLPVNSALSLSQYYLYASILTLIFGFMMWLKSAPQKSTSDSFPSKELINTCMPLWAVAILSQIIQWSSQLMLGAWSSAESVAFFATAQRTAMLISFVLFAVNAIAAPKFAAMYAQNDLEGLKRMANISVRLLLVFAIPALSLMLFFPEWIMSFFGEEFRKASTALMILALGQFVNVATGSVGYLLSMTGHEKSVRNNAFFSAIIGIGLGILLIPEYGLLGASISTAIGIASQNLLGVYQVKKHLGINTLLFWKS